MPIMVINNGRASETAAHLHAISSDPSLIVDVGSRTIAVPDGGTATVKGSGNVAFRTPPNLSDPTLPNGTRLLASLASPFSSTTVVIQALGSNDLDFRGTSITESAGVTSPIYSKGGQSFIQIDYDVEGCNRGTGFEHGYFVVGQDGKQLEMPPGIVLYHELVHAWRKINSVPAASPDDEELETAKLENLFRAEKSLGLRSVTKPTHHLGGAACLHAVAAAPKTTKSGGCLTVIIALVGVVALSAAAVPRLLGYSATANLVAGVAVLGLVLAAGLARRRRKANRVSTAFGNELPDASQVDRSRLAYTITISNQTDLTPFPVVFEELVVTFTRTGQAGVEFRFSENVAPGKGVVFPLCLCRELDSYAWGFRFKVFDATAGMLIDVWDGGLEEDPPGSGDFRFRKYTAHTMDADETMRTGAPVECSDSFKVGP